MKEKIKCESCQKGKELFWTEDQKEIEEVKKKQVVKKMKLFCEVAKKKAEEKPEELLDYIKGVNPFDVSYEEWNEGFLRKPRTDQEKKKAELYCLHEPFEPMEVSELENGEQYNCAEYKPKEEKKK